MKTIALLTLGLVLLTSSLASAQLETAFRVGGGISSADYSDLKEPLLSNDIPAPDNLAPAATVNFQMRKVGSRWAGNIGFSSSVQSDQTDVNFPEEEINRFELKAMGMSLGVDYFIVDKNGFKLFPGIALLTNQAELNLYKNLPNDRTFASFLSADIESAKFYTYWVTLLPRLNIEFEMKMTNRTQLVIGLNGSYQLGSPSDWRYSTPDDPLLFFSNKIGKGYYAGLSMGIRSRAKTSN